MCKTSSNLPINIKSLWVAGAEVLVCGVSLFRHASVAVDDVSWVKSCGPSITVPDLWCKWEFYMAKESGMMSLIKKKHAPGLSKRWSSR